MNRNSNNPNGEINRRKPTVMKIKTSTVLKFLAGGLLAFVAADLQAQLLYKCKFSAVEGYTNGWAIGQPSIGNKWSNANADTAWVLANEANPTTYSPINEGRGYWQEGAPGEFFNVTATNCTAPGGGQMMIAADNNQGTNVAGVSTRGTYFFRMDFPNQVAGPVTVTWDWQYLNPAVEIPPGYDPTNDNATLPGFDHGFTLSDWANRTADTSASDTPNNPNWKYSELSTPTRISTWADSRRGYDNAVPGVNDCAGDGTWLNFGPPFKDGVTLHMKVIAYHGIPADPYNNTYDVFAQRADGDVYQTADHTGLLGIEVSPNWMRRCPPTGINCLMLWLNGQVEPKYVLVSNIRVVGPNPVAVPTVSIARNGANVEVTFTPGSWLEEKSIVPGLASDWTTVAVTSPYTVSAALAAQKFYRAVN